jgi:hypothetical protein
MIMVEEGIIRVEEDNPSGLSELRRACWMLLP